MIDTMFLLLMFFMLNAGMSQRELEELTPPLTRHASQDSKQNPDRITVNVHHDPDDPKNPKCPPFVAGDVCRNDAHWHISMAGRRYELTKEGMSKFAQALTNLGKAKLEDPAKGISAYTLIIRADRTAASGHVQKVMEQCGLGRIYKTENSVWVTKGTVVERPATQPDRAESRPPLPALPARIANELHEIKVTLIWHAREGVVERRIGHSAIPEGPQGDTILEEAVRAEVRRSRPAAVTVIIAVDPTVPWRAVVDILDAGKRAGVENLEFGTWDEAESRGAESRPSSRK